MNQNYATSYRHANRILRGTNLGSKKIEDNDDNNDQDDYFVTDEEALLACRAFLQRKNRVGWIQAKQRKALALNSLALSSSTSTLSQSPTAMDDIIGSTAATNLNAGYFWEDPSELLYLRRGRPRRMTMEGNTSSLFDDDKETNLSLQSSQIEYDEEEIDDDVDDEQIKSSRLRKAEDANNEESFGIFTSFPVFPSTTHVLQSQAKKKQFQDPEWKAKWYQSRWANATVGQKFLRTKRQKRLKQLIQKIPSEILRSDELASLSDEEIEEAIRTYVLGNKRRMESHLKRSEERKRKYQDNRISVQSYHDELHPQHEMNNTKESVSQLSFTPSEDELKRVQRKRSSRATKAYATRLRNLETKEAETKKPQGMKSRTSSNMRQVSVRSKLAPKIAMERIQEMVRAGKMPLMDDIDSILKPERLAGRKVLFQMILSSCFNLRGKCVPDISKKKGLDPDCFYSNYTDTDMVTKKFVSKSTVSELGSFLKYLLSRKDL